MPFDPTKPVEQTEIDAAELRNQFNGLKSLNDDLQQTANSQQETTAQLQSQIQDQTQEIADLQDAVNALQGNNP